MVTLITSYLATFPIYGGLLVQFSLLTERVLLFNAHVRVNPKVRIARVGLQKLETPFCI